MILSAPKQGVQSESTTGLSRLMKSALSRRQPGWKQSIAASVLLHSLGFASLVSVSSSTPSHLQLQLRQGQTSTDAISFEATVATIESPHTAINPLNPEVLIPIEIEPVPMHCIEISPQATEHRRKQLSNSELTLTAMFEVTEMQSSIAKTVPMKASMIEDAIVEIANPIRIEMPKPKSRDSSLASISIPIPIAQFSGVAKESDRVPLSTNEPPKYPSVEMQRGIGGRVVLRLTVEPNGSVSAVEIEVSSGVEGLDRAAKEAVVRWRFEPLDSNLGSQSDIIIAPIAFRIR